MLGCFHNGTPPGGLLLSSNPLCKMRKKEAQAISPATTRQCAFCDCGKNHKPQHPAGISGTFPEASCARRQTTPQTLEPWFNLSPLTIPWTSRPWTSRPWTFHRSAPFISPLRHLACATPRGPRTSGTLHQTTPKHPEPLLNLTPNPETTWPAPHGTSGTLFEPDISPFPNHPQT